VFRLNFSHGTVDDHRARIRLVHELAAREGRLVGTLGDLQGPKIRLGLVVDEGVDVPTGGEVVLIAGVPRVEVAVAARWPDHPVLPVVYPGLAQDVATGSSVLIDDGSIRLTVVSSDVERGEVVCAVDAGGRATSRKGVNLPGVRVSADSITDKDRADLATMVELGVDWIAQSFVRTVEDVLEVGGSSRRTAARSPSSRSSSGPRSSTTSRAWSPRPTPS